MDQEVDAQRHTAGFPRLLGLQSHQRARAGHDGRRHGERVLVQAVLQLRVRQAWPSVPVGPVAERRVPARRRPVLGEIENGQHARLSAQVHRQRAAARRPDAARQQAAVGRVRRRRQDAGDRGRIHELHAGDLVAQREHERDVQLVLHRARVGQHIGRVVRQRGGLGLRLVLVRHAQRRVQHRVGQDHEHRLCGMGCAVPGGPSTAILDLLRLRVRQSRLAVDRIDVCSRCRFVY